MKYLLKYIDKLEGELSDKYIILFLDYDGTLTPIVETPERAIISKEMKGLLRRLSKVKNLKLTIVSGRSLKDIKNTVRLNGIIYVGNHGLEIEGPKIKFESPVSETHKTTLKKIKRALDERLAAIKGVFIEDKGLTLSVHYRLVDDVDELALKNIFYGTVKPYLTKDAVRITYGKKVFEIRPPIKWDKGKAVIWLLARERFVRGEKDVLPVYIGDDITDESAFRALKGKGLTIFVGGFTLSQTEYYLNDTGEVIEFLKEILAVRKG